MLVTKNRHIIKLFILSADSFKFKGIFLRSCINYLKKEIIKQYFHHQLKNRKNVENKSNQKISF